ncbi:phosphotransferase enzyme family protein [Phialemonium atrogriseum]|uniref:Phosphotransferase enzyme family protein n=1 Tax=Phialemonium atrogriseum TaxID=1093897 RepID=A0AAJ0FLF1_9PEZI|nr:phosphotransferase enzyme family protein [Phialemonium atrogriseum]KAK1765045.1 phosphotransferase enzyme family protein [Phialemonium atrogriseum]
MDYNKCIDLIHDAQKDVWVDRVNAGRVDGRMCNWVSTLHPDRLPCRLDGGFLHGAYNLYQKFIFADNTTWILRFPRVGAICDDYADEKIAMEVEVLSLVRERTSIPVPVIYSWGLAADNPLGLGAFILMEFIEGVSANHFLRDPKATADTRLMRGDISDSDVEILFRQIAGFQLQLFELDFDRIGSLPTPKTGCRYFWYVLLFLCLVFSTTKEYFEYVVVQDCKQLIQQPNSVAAPYDAENKYTSFRVLASLVPGMINERYSCGQFKLICDDLGLANLILKSDTDLTVVGVVDLEWSYVGPAQLFASAPWWLLQDRPINPECDCDDNQPPDMATRYFRYLEIYKRVLEEEESKRPGHERKEVSDLVRWSEDSGAMWLHMLLSCGFNDTYSFPFMQLRQHVGVEKWKKRRWAVDPDEVRAFVAQKMLQLEEYDADLAKTEADKACVDRGELTRREFIAKYSHTLTNSATPDF